MKRLLFLFCSTVVCFSVKLYTADVLANEQEKLSDISKKMKKLEEEVSRLNKIIVSGNADGKDFFSRLITAEKSILDLEKKIHGMENDMQKVQKQVADLGKADREGFVQEFAAYKKELDEIKRLKEQFQQILASIAQREQSQQISFGDQKNQLETFVSGQKNTIETFVAEKENALSDTVKQGISSCEKQVNKVRKLMERCNTDVQRIIQQKEVELNNMILKKKKEVELFIAEQKKDLEASYVNLGDHELRMRKIIDRLLIFGSAAVSIPVTFVIGKSFAFFWATFLKALKKEELIPVKTWVGKWVKNALLGMGTLGLFGAMCIVLEKAARTVILDEPFLDSLSCFVPVF